MWATRLLAPRFKSCNLQPFQILQPYNLQPLYVCSRFVGCRLFVYPAQDRLFTLLWAWCFSGQPAKPAYNNQRGRRQGRSLQIRRTLLSGLWMGPCSNLKRDPTISKNSPRTCFFHKPNTTEFPEAFFRTSAASRDGRTSPNVAKPL